MIAGASIGTDGVRTGQIVELQSIRGIAALLVLVGHALGYAAVTPDWLMPARVLSNGHASVVLFFVLSWFVLTRSLRGRGSFSDTGRYYVKRAFRIYPLLIVATLFGVSYLTTMHFQLRVDGSSDWFEGFVRADRIGPLWFILAAAGMPYVLPQVWSIFIELVGSLLLPLLAWSLMHRPPLFYVLALVLAVISFTVLKSSSNVAVYLVDFAIGAWLAVPPRRLTRWLGSLGQRTVMMGFAAAVVALIGLRSVWPAEYHDPALQLAEAGLSALALGMVIYSRLDLPALRSHGAVWLGDISYSLYLLHFTVMCVAGRLIGVVLTPAAHPGLFSLVLVAVTLAVSLALASQSYRFIEMPGVALGARVARRGFRNRAVALG